MDYINQIKDWRDASRTQKGLRSVNKRDSFSFTHCSSSASIPDSFHLSYGDASLGVWIYMSPERIWIAIKKLRINLGRDATPEEIYLSEMMPLAKKMFSYKFEFASRMLLDLDQFSKSISYKP